jgi:hypothetical protein
MNEIQILLKINQVFFATPLTIRKRKIPRLG